MAAIAAITIADGQATPVNHTFNPVSTTPATYRENGSATVPVIGQSNLVVDTSLNASQTGISKTKVVLVIPVLETASGSTVGGYTPAPTVAYYLTAKLEFLMPSRSTAAQRKDLRVLLRNLLVDNQLVSAIDNLETSY